MESLTDETAFETFAAQPLSLVFFTSPSCGICVSLKEKLIPLLGARFPQLAIAQIDVSQHPALAAQQQVLAIPTVVLYHESREQQRFFHSFSTQALIEAIERPYSFIFSDNTN